MATTTGSQPAELEALRLAFSYLVNGLDASVLLPVALSRQLITERQRSDCAHEQDPYKKVEKFLGHLQRTVNGDSIKFHTFIHVLYETGQANFASRLCDELSHATRSMQSASMGSSEGPGEQVIVPDELVEELADLRVAFAMLLRKYEKELHSSPEAQEEFVAFLPKLFRKVGCSDHSFKSSFDKLVEEKVSLFNIHYLKSIYIIFPEDICDTTRKLVDQYEQQCQHFMASTRVSQFKKLFPASATPYKLSAGKTSITLKIKKQWDSDTLDDLIDLANLFGDSGSHLHLFKVVRGCIAVTWLCSIIDVKDLKKAIFEAAESIQAKKVLRVLVGDELMWECSQPKHPKQALLSRSVSTLRSEFKPLWETILEENLDSFKQQFRQLSREAQIEIIQVYNEGETLLHVACDKAAADIVAMLLHTMAEPEIESNQREELLWLLDIAKKWTPLHYACRQQRADIVKQLLHPPWPNGESIFARTCPQTIPSTVTMTLLSTNTTLEIIQLLLQHSRGNPLYGFNDFNTFFPSCQLPKSSLERAVPIVVLGDKKSGKSTIIKSLQIEGAWARLLYFFKNVSGAAQHKGQVISTQAPEHSYLGKVVFFELSSNREFVLEAILEIGHLVDAVFIIVINTKEKIDVMKEQMVIWADFIQQQMKKSNINGTSLQPNVIIIGSHRDVLPLGRWAAPNERFLLAYHKAMEKAPLKNCNILSHYTMDFRKSTVEVHLIQSKLYRELERLRRHRPLLPSISYVLYSVINDLCEQKKVKAITLHELLWELTNASTDHYLLLPQDAGELLDYCERLKQLNIILVLKDSEKIGNSWILTDPLPLLAEIEEAVFSNTNDVIPAYHTMNSNTPVEDEWDLSSSRLSLVLSQQITGIMERGELERKFHSVTDPATTDTGLLIKVMKHFKYADEILLPQPPPKPDRPCFYIPDLLPRKLDYKNWHFNDPEYTYMGTWAMIPEEFLYFMPHHIHQLLLHISLSDIVPLHCSRSLRTLAWADPSMGAQILISDYNSEALVLNMRCFKGNEIKCLKLRSTIINELRSLMAVIDHEFSFCEIMVPRSRVECTKFRKRLPILNPLHHDLWYCKMDDIKGSISRAEEDVATNDPTNLVKIDDLLYFEPYSRLCKMPEELQALLRNSDNNEILSEAFVLELLAALGHGVVNQNALQLFLDITDTKISLLQDSDNPKAIAGVATNIRLTYSQLCRYLDSICVIKLQCRRDK